MTRDRTIRRRARSVGVLFAVLSALLLAGCNILFPGSPFNGSEGEPSPIAKLTMGSATLRLGDGTTITLNRVVPGSNVMTSFSSVRWSNDQGWSLMAAELDTGLGLGSNGYLVIDRIFENQHWTTYDPSRCVVTISAADKTGVRGSATCKGLEWSDALGAGFGPEPSEVGQPAFDAEITFSAEP